MICNNVERHFEGILVNEISWREKDKHCMFLLCVESKQANKKALPEAGLQEGRQNGRRW